MSPAWRGMSMNARRALERIELEQMAHAGTENGNLVVTHKDFIQHGVTHNRVADAINELAAFRLIQITQAGKAGTGTSHPNKFELTWFPLKGSFLCDEIWKRTTLGDVKLWKHVGRNKAKSVRSKKAAKRIKSPLKKQFPTTTCWGGSLQHVGVKSVKTCNKKPKKNPIPTTTSWGTLNILGGSLGITNSVAATVIPFDPDKADAGLDRIKQLARDGSP